MNGLAYNSHTHAYFRDMQLLKLDDLFNLYLLTNMFDKVGVVTNAVETRVHNHNTRNRTQINLPRFNRSATQASIVYQQVAKWVRLPPDLLEARAKVKFKARMKAYLLAFY